MSEGIATAGYTGTVTVDGVTICASSTTFDEDMALNESPSYCGSGDMEYTRGMKTYTGTIETYTRIAGDTGTLVISNSNNASTSYTCEVFFNSKSMNQPSTDNLTFSHGFTVQGTPTIT